MGTNERRWQLLKTICRQRHETIANLAEKFGVSERTIRRDIEVLSLSEPIYTSPGRYNGGVYVVEGYYIDKSYFNTRQREIIQKLIDVAEDEDVYSLEKSEISILKEMINAYTKPSINAQKNKNGGWV